MHGIARSGRFGPSVAVFGFPELEQLVSVETCFMVLPRYEGRGRRHPRRWPRKEPSCNDLRILHPLRVKHPLLALLSQALAPRPRDRVENLSLHLLAKPPSASFSAVSTKCRRGLIFLPLEKK
jgi:hypothetical protein